MKHYYHSTEQHDIAIFRRRDARYFFTERLARMTINEVCNSQCLFDRIDTDKIQKILNEYSPFKDWRVTRVGRNKIVFETMAIKNIKPAYKTWVYWKDNRSYEVFSGSEHCEFEKRVV